MSRISGLLYQSFYSLRNRNFRLYFSGQMISNTGNWLTNVALTLLVFKLSGSGLAVGLVAACQYGPILCFSAYAGALADRRDKRTMLLISQTLEMLQSISLTLLAFMHHPPLVGLYIVAIAGGIILAFDNPLRRSFVSEMVPKKDLPNAVVLYAMIVNSSRIFGPALAGLLIVTVGYGWCFALDAGSYAVVLFCIYRMRPRELHRSPPHARLKGEIRDGLRYVFATPVLWISFSMLIIIQMLSYNFNVTLPLFVTHSLHRNVTSYTILYSIFSLGAVVSGLVIANRGLVKIRNIIVGAAGMGTTMLLLALVPTIWSALPVIFFVGVASILYLTASTAIAQIETRKDMIGRVLSLQTVILGGASLIGAPLLGWLADLLGGRAPLVIGGIAALIAAGFGYCAVQRTGAATLRGQAPNAAEEL